MNKMHQHTFLICFFLKGIKNKKKEKILKKKDKLYRELVLCANLFNV